MILKDSHLKIPLDVIKYSMTNLNAENCLNIFNASKPHIKNFRTAVDVGCRDGDFTIPLSKHFASVKAFDYR